MCRAIYVFMACYSPGEGPVPFTYSAEAFPLHLRDVGMSFATAGKTPYTQTPCETHTDLQTVCWGFNFILSLTWPALVEAFTAQGAFGWYAAWNFFGWVYCYFLLPETKNLTLEELDTVFQTKVLRRDLAPMPPLYELHDEKIVGQDFSVPATADESAGGYDEKSAAPRL
jgi:hypothetical protein